MSATLTTLRPGETIKVRATPVNSDGTSPGKLHTIEWDSSDDAIFTAAVDDADPYLCSVTGVAPGGPAGVYLAFFGHDEFHGSVLQHNEPVQVLNATRFRFSPRMATLLLEPEPLAANIVGVFVAALPWDVRDDGFRPEYTGLTEILWTSANGSVLFNGLRGLGGTETLADDLRAFIFPDYQLLDDDMGLGGEATTDVITVTAKNSFNETITGTLPVTIRRVKTITITPVP